MAVGESLGELYARIGLDVDNLERNFVQVDRTLSDNMARLNRQRNIIDLQARVDLAGLDAASDATRIFQIRQQALQQQIETQKTRLQILSNVLTDARNRTGDLSDETQRAQLNYERARLSLANLERNLRNLNQTQSQTSAGWRDMVQSFSEQLSVVSSRAVIEGITEALRMAATASIELVNRFKEVEKQAYELNMPFEKTRDFLRQVRLSGGDIGDFEGFVRGISDAMVKGEYDDPEAIAFRRYNETAFDANGHIKNFEEMTAAIKRMYDQAKAAGEEIEFLQMLGGESGVRDAIQLLERWDESQKDTSRIFKASIDEAEMKRAERSINLVTEQLGELKDEVVGIFTPATINAADEFFEIFRASTKFIQENRVELSKFAEAMVTAFERQVMPTKIIWDMFKSPKQDIKSIGESVKEVTAGIKTLNKIEEPATGNNVLSQYGIQRVKQFRDELEDLRLELDYADDFERKIAEIELWRKRELNDKLYVTSDEKLAIEELYAAKIENVKSAQAEHIEKIEQESANRTKALMRETADIQFETAHSAFEKEIRDIQIWAQESISALDKYKDAVRNKNLVIEESMAIATNAMAKEREAFEREMDRIKGANQSLAEKIFEQEHSRRDVDIMRAQKERAQLYEQGIYSAEMIERNFRNRMGEIAYTASQDRNYSRKPKWLSQQSAGGIPIIYGDQLSNYAQAKLPQTDFYGNIQSQVEQAMSKADHPAQQIAQKFQESIQQLSQSLNTSTQNLNQVTQNLNSFCTSVEKYAVQQPPQIYLTVAPNIDLGGAYVFDNSMKTQLTDDITDQVVLAVKDAFQKSVSSLNYSYGN